MSTIPCPVRKPHWASDRAFTVCKADFLVISKQSMSDKIDRWIQRAFIYTVLKAQNIGCYIDTTLCMNAQVNNVTWSCYSSLHKIGHMLN